MSRKTYHITRTSEGWQGKAEGNKRASVTGKTKKEVAQKTTDIAKKQGNTSVIYHTKDGKIQEERTYPRRSDPYPPKG